MRGRIFLAGVEGEDLGAARLALDREQFLAGLAVELGEREGAGRFDRQPHLGA